jgi:hypothetical protein
VTREEVWKTPRKEPKDLLTEEYPLMAITVALNLEWWRGYYAAKLRADDEINRPNSVSFV